ncbi:Kazal-type serine protease inhibitor family protein [Brucella sp. IR073]|uniref:Kazal-type serine protease inhibitor family protein n=1 Tax=unclassified Brucella TaxID=2632610 RepID=UPI003B97E4CC
MTIFSMKMPGLSVLALFLLAGCAVAEDGGRPGPRPGGPVMCPMIYAPVCGERGGVRQTFGNACQAGAKGFRVVRKGECGTRRSSSGIPKWPAIAGPGPVLPPQLRRPARPSFCTEEYAPVCARRGRSVKTFPNACFAKREGYRVLRRGACR